MRERDLQSLFLGAWNGSACFRCSLTPFGIEPVFLGFV